MKRITAALSAFCLLLSLLVFQTQAASNGQEAFAVNDDLYLLLETSPGSFEKEQLKNFKLRETDVPLSMRNTDILSSDAIVRLKIMENDLNSLVYLNADGTLSAFIFGEEVKYISDNSVIDKTNCLKYDIERQVYFNPDNDIKVNLPMFLDLNNTINVSDDDYLISMYPITSVNSIVAEKCFKSDKENYVVYSNVFGDCSKLVYSPMFSGLKEDIIIEERPAEAESYSFRIITNGLRAVPEDEGIILLDENDSVIAFINNLEIFDSAGHIGYGSVELIEIEENREYEYTIIVDTSFLFAENTVYPVTIDPTVTFNSTTKIKDVQVTQNILTVNHTATLATIGYNTSNSLTSRLFVKFPTLQTFLNSISTADQICEATFNFYCNSTIGSFEFYYFYPCTQNWNPDSSVVNSTLFNSFNSNISAAVIINGSGSYTVNLTTLFKYFKTNSAYYGFVLKKFNESNLNCAVVKTIDNTSNKPYVSIHYSETLPTSEAFNIVNKSIYRIKNTHTQKYLTKNATVSGTTVNMEFDLESSNPNFGSTREKSQFVSVNYIGGGKYTLSFLMPPTSSSSSDTTTGYSTNYYLSAHYSSGTATLNYSTNAYTVSQWYIVYDSSTFSYKFLNVSNPCFYLASSGSSSLAVTESVADEQFWTLERCGFDVPVYMQDKDNACGWACTCMILKYYGISVSENDVRGYIDPYHPTNDFSASYITISQALNHFLSNQDPVYDYDDSLVSLSYNNYRLMLSSYLTFRPVVLLCKFNSSSQFGWGTNGHFIVVKGIVEINGTYKFLVNDSYKANCRERVIDSNELREYNDDKGGYVVYAY